MRQRAEQTRSRPPGRPPPRRSASRRRPASSAPSGRSRPTATSASSVPPSATSAGASDRAEREPGHREPLEQRRRRGQEVRRGDSLQERAGRPRRPRRGRHRRQARQRAPGRCAGGIREQQHERRRTRGRARPRGAGRAAADPRAGRWRRSRASPPSAEAQRSDTRPSPRCGRAPPPRARVEDVEGADRDELQAEQEHEGARRPARAGAPAAPRRPRRSPSGRRCGGTWGSGATTIAPTATAAVAATKTEPGPRVSSRTPVSAGATSTLALSIQDETTFTAVRSDGVRASDGVSAAWQGRTSVRPSVGSAPSTYTTIGSAPASSATAIAARVDGERRVGDGEHPRWAGSGPRTSRRPARRAPPARAVPARRSPPWWCRRGRRRTRSSRSRSTTRPR